MPFNDLIHRAQTQLQWWTKLVQSSGGELNPTKCCCAIYHWSPDTNGILRPSDPPSESTTILSDPTQPNQKIPILALNEGTRYLGIYVTRSGATKPMEDHVWKTATTYTRAFQRTHMSRREANVLYRSCFLPALTYSFPATWMPHQFLERIHKLSTSTILNKMGLHSCLPRSMVFAPREVGGVGLCNLIHEQGTQQLLILLRHLRSKTALGTAIEGLIRTYQVWTGLPHHVLSDTQPCPWVPDHWLSQLRKTMHAYNIQIEYRSWTYPPLRQDDRFLMSDFVDLNLHRHQLEKLNACRMFLQVTTLAELTDHTGTILLPHILLTARHLQPKGLLNISSSHLQWPRVATPSTTCWRLWSTTIRTLYTGSKNGTRLQQPLGPWLPDYDKHQFWHWRLYDPTHLMFQHSPEALPRVALQTYCNRTLVKFSPTIPMTLPFVGNPVTPVDTTTCYVALPIPPIPPLLSPTEPL